MELNIPAVKGIGDSLVYFGERWRGKGGVAPWAIGEPGAPNELPRQVFTQAVIGPVFFEVIQRKGDQGFGEGNVRTLFESIELDQLRRGYRWTTA